MARALNSLSRTLLATACALAPAQVAEAAPAPAVPAPSDEGRPSQTIDVPLQLNGFYVGDISVGIASDGTVTAVDGERFSALLQARTDEATQSQLKEALQRAGGRYVGLKSVSLEGLAVTYDSANLQVAVTLSAARAPVQQIGLDSATKTTSADLIEPGGFNGALNFNAAKHWINKATHDSSLEGLQPTTASVDGYFNLGGINGVYLYHEWSYDGGRAHKLQRGPTVLVHDVVSHGTRLMAGDITPLTSAFQGTTQLLGVQFGTAYSEIQPNRNIRPAGHTSFVLDRTSRVDVQINGLTVRTLTLTPGRYDLRNLSLTDGANDVRLMVEDTSGRRELLSFSGLFSSELLARGLTDFSIAAGFAREASDNGFRYHTGRPKLTGIIKRGFTDTLTAGANLQLGRSIANAGAEVVAALPIGTLSGQMSGSRAYGKVGLAAALGLRYSRSSVDHPTDFDILWRYRSARYHGLDEADLRNDLGHIITASIRQALPMDVYASVGASYSVSRSKGGDPRYSLGVARAFGRIQANLFAEHARDISGRSETFFVASLSVRLDSRSSLRAQYRSRTRERIVEMDRSAYNAIGEWGARFGYSASAGQRTIEGDVSYYTNRGEVGARTGMLEVAATGHRLVDTTFRAALGVGFAGGKFAVGRPVPDGFAIVSRHPTLGGNRVSIPAGLSGGSLATTDFLGPALVPVSRAYQPQQLDVSVHDLPVGYDAGSPRYSLMPGARSGLALTVGTDAVNSVIGVLAYSDGEPISLKTGALRAIGSKDRETHEIFTNRTGRFAAEKLRPGKYAIVIDEKETGATLTIPENANGLVQAGRISVAKQ